MRPPVLHIIPFLWSGAGSVVTRLCEAQRRQGPVAIVTSGRIGEMADWDAYRRRLRKAGVAHHTIDFFRRDAEVFWPGVSALATLIRRLRPGVIHAHAGVPCCGAAIARATAGQRMRLIGQMYSWGPHRPDWMNVQDTWGLGQTDRVVCSAHAYVEELIRYGVPKRKLVYVPWGLPLDRLKLRNSKITARDTSSPVIGFVGRIEPRKQQRELVAAFAHVRKTYPDARLDLVGPVADEAYAAGLRSDIEAADLTDPGLIGAVRVPGEVRDAAVWMRRWDLFVSLSSDEGQGLAVLEAMALGIPVAARLVAGISDFLQDRRNGIAIAKPGAEAAGRAIVRTLAQPALRTLVARAARRLVERRYDWAQTVRIFERFYWQ